MPTQKQIFQALWRKAYRQGTLTLDFKSTAEAHKVRFGLYNAMKGIKRGQEFDSELEAAGKAMILQLRGASITLTKLDQTETFEKLLAAAGDALEGESKTQVELDAAAIEQRMLERLGGSELPGAVKNPFYTRD